MSTRQVRRLLELKKKNEPPPKAELEEEEESEPESQPNVRNAFALLNNESSHDEGASDDDEPKVQKPAEAPKPKQKPGKKKKGKKGKGGEAAKGNADDVDVEATVREVDELLKNSGANGAYAAHSGFTPSGPAFSVMKVNFRHLNADVEMKRKFGVTMNRVDVRGRKVPRLNANIIHPLRNWPSWEKIKLSMVLLRTEKGISYFKYEYSPDYMKTQFRLEAALRNLEDANLVPEILNNDDPYHVDALIQAAEAYQFSEEVEAATGVTERAVFACQLAFHSAFSITSGQCRLEFKYRENRSFYYALMRHIRYVGDKGGFRTALELCKVLYNLDPDTEPLALLLVMDYYAIYSEEYSWVLDVYEEWRTCKSLEYLPNWRFSYALAKYFLSQSQPTGDAAPRRTLKDADEALKIALYHFPGFLMRVLEKCHVKPHEEPGFEYFKKARDKEPRPIGQLIELYLARSYVLWKATDIMQWIERNVSEFLSTPAAKRVPKPERAFSPGMETLPLNIVRHMYVSGLSDQISGFGSLMVRMSGRGNVLAIDPFPPPDNVVTHAPPPAPRGATSRLPPLRNAGGMLGFARLVLDSMRPEFGGMDLPGSQMQRMLQAELWEWRNRAQAQGEAEVGLDARPMDGFGAWANPGVGDDPEDEELPELLDDHEFVAGDGNEVLRDPGREDPRGDEAPAPDLQQSINGLVMTVRDLLSSIPYAGVPAERNEENNDVQHTDSDWEDDRDLRGE